MPGIKETVAANWFVCLNSEKSFSKVFSLWSNPNKEPSLGRSCREELGTVAGVGIGVCCGCGMRGMGGGGSVVADKKMVCLRHSSNLETSDQSKLTQCYDY
ncbi:hypothetical protein Tco_1371261 [Tanacetum coccineum]